MKLSKAPLIGGLFQPAQGRGTLDEAYDRMTEIRQVKGTYNRLVEDGRRAEAKEFVQNYANDLAAASTSGATVADSSSVSLARNWFGSRRTLSHSSNARHTASSREILSPSRGWLTRYSTAVMS